MLEADEKDIEKLKRSFLALWENMGGHPFQHPIRDFIEHVSESMAYQYALRRNYEERLRDYVLEERHRTLREKA